MGGACTKSTVYQPVERTTETESIDRQLDEAKAREELHFKILCLGAGESGKSTVIKQLTFIHKQQLTPEERISYVKVLQNNTVQCMITLIKEAEAFGYTSQFSDLERAASEAVCNYDQRVDMTYELLESITALWHSEPIQLTYSRRNEYWHLEATDYYFSNAERYVADGFIPTEEDMVMARKRTTGVVVTELDYGGVHWSCVDVGGQRSERRKWLNCFDNVKAIVYVVNLAGYCKVLFEDKAVNRMHESLNLFEATMSNPLFQHTPVFIFLNKKDLFEQLLRTQPIDCCFPDYQGSNDLHSCIEYISEEYERRLPVGRRDKPTFLLLAARMKKDVQYCFEEVKDLLLDTHRKQIGKAKKALERVEKRNRQAADGEEGEGEEGDGQAGGAKEQKYQVRGLQGWEATRKGPKVGGGVKKPLPANMLATVKPAAATAGSEEKQASEAKAEEQQAAAAAEESKAESSPTEQLQVAEAGAAQAAPHHDVSHAAIISSASNPLSTPTAHSSALPPLRSHGSSAGATAEPSTAASYNNQHDTSMAVQSAAIRGSGERGPRHSTSSNSMTQSHLNPVSQAANAAHITPTVSPRGGGRARGESREAEEEWAGRDRAESGGGGGGGGAGGGQQRIKEVEEVKENDEHETLLVARAASDALPAVQQVS